MYECVDAMVVTNSTFSQQAVKTARATGVRLWDREELVKHLLEAEDALVSAQHASEPAAAVAAATASPAAFAASASEYADATCAECGTPVSEKVHLFCIANAARFGGLVYCFWHQRRFRRSPSLSS